MVQRRGGGLVVGLLDRKTVRFIPETCGAYTSECSRVHITPLVDSMVDQRGDEWSKGMSG